MKRGDIYTVSIPCAYCGSVAVLNIWYEKERDGSYKRYGMIYCTNPECSNKTKLHGGRTPEETKREAFYDWKARNRAINAMKERGEYEPAQNKTQKICF